MQPTSDHLPLPWAVSNAERGLVLKAFARHRPALFGALLLTLVVLAVVVGPLLGPNPDLIDTAVIYRGPGAAHLLGTDQLGRDLLARTIAGGRLSLTIGLLATLLTAVVGIVYGLLSALGPRWLDHMLMQLLDTFLAIPLILLAILIQATGELSLVRLAVAIALVSWLGVARIVRSECQRILGSDFIKAAVATGSGVLRLVWRHLLPNIGAPLLVVLTASVGQALILEATLSFLNLGVPSNVPSWGNLLGNGMSAALNGAWWCVVFPGLLITVTVLSINLVGDGLRDVIDPRSRMRS